MRFCMAGQSIKAVAEPDHLFPSLGHEAELVVHILPLRAGHTDDLRRRYGASGEDLQYFSSQGGGLRAPF